MKLIEKVKVIEKNSGLLVLDEKEEESSDISISDKHEFIILFLRCSSSRTAPESILPSKLWIVSEVWGENSFQKNIAYRSVVTHVTYNIC